MVFFSAAGITQDREPGGKRMMGPYESIENKASLATAEDPTSIRALADEVLSFPHSFPRMPGAMETVVKERLVNAELMYRRGDRQGIQEDRIVQTFNNLSARLGGPPHSFTTPSQIRVLRMWLALAEPKFMATGMTREGATPGESINPNMGPLQAAHLISVLIDQKFTNPDFQVSPQEWDQVSRQKVTDEIFASQVRLAEIRANPAAPRRTTTLMAKPYSPDRRRELEQSLVRSISALSVEDGLGLANHVFTALGID
jgi:hypothetical protein